MAGNCGRRGCSTKSSRNCGSFPAVVSTSWGSLTKSPCEPGTASTPHWLATSVGPIAGVTPSPHAMAHCVSSFAGTNGGDAPSVTCGRVEAVDGFNISDGIGPFSALSIFAGQSFDIIQRSFPLFGISRYPTSVQKTFRAQPKPRALVPRHMALDPPPIIFTELVRHKFDYFAIPLFEVHGIVNRIYEFRLNGIPAIGSRPNSPVAFCLGHLGSRRRNRRLGRGRLLLVLRMIARRTPQYQNSDHHHHNDQDEFCTPGTPTAAVSWPPPVPAIQASKPDPRRAVIGRPFRVSGCLGRIAMRAWD